MDADVNFENWFRIFEDTCIAGAYFAEIDREMLREYYNAGEGPYKLAKKLIADIVPEDRFDPEDDRPRRKKRILGQHL